MDILTKYCDEYGRRIEDMELSWSGDMILAEDRKQLQRKVENYRTQSGIICTFSECIERLQEYVDLGCSHFVFSLGTFNEEKEAFIEAIVPSF